MISLTEEQVTGLAPDAASLKAANGLVKQAKWPRLEYSEKAIWGDCQGSGKNPYVTMIDLKDMTSKCSCPSRKFPCKHGLALLFNFCRHPEWFTKQDEETEGVKAWLEKRTATAEKREQKAREKAEQAASGEIKAPTKAQLKRQEERNRRVYDGVEELQLFIRDMVRNGMINFLDDHKSMFDDLSRRLIDAQAPGLARFVSSLSSLPKEDQPKWHHDLFKQLSLIYMLCDAYKHIDSLPYEWQEEIRRLIGFTTSKEDVIAHSVAAAHIKASSAAAGTAAGAAAPVVTGGVEAAAAAGGAAAVTEFLAGGIEDDYLVLTQQCTEQPNGTSMMFWCYGLSSRVTAQYLMFVPNNAAAASAMVDKPLLPGACYHGRMHFFPGPGTVRRGVFESQRLVSTGTVNEIIMMSVPVESFDESQLLLDDKEYARQEAEKEKAEQNLRQRIEPDINQLPECVRHITFDTLPDFASANAHMLEFMAQNPFASYCLVAVANIRFACKGKTDGSDFYVVDEGGRALPVKLSDQNRFNLIVFTRGQPFTGVFLFNPNSMELCGIGFDGRYIPVAAAYSSRKGRMVPVAGSVLLGSH